MRGDKETRAGDETAVDGVAQVGIEILHGFGAEVAVGGVAGEKGGADMVGGANGAFDYGLITHLFRGGALTLSDSFCS